MMILKATLKSMRVRVCVCVNIAHLFFDTFTRINISQNGSPRSLSLSIWAKSIVYPSIELRLLQLDFILIV
jgi:hypothetical protein